jgi:hypothetical protein
MSEIPTPVSESTAIEVVRKEGSTFSAKSVDNTLTAGDIVQYNASGILKATGLGSGVFETIAGVLLYTCASGNRGVAIRGKVRATWDGASTTLNYGAPIAVSTTHSGWFEASSGDSIPIGVYVGLYGGSQLAAANSGQLAVVEIQ